MSIGIMINTLSIVVGGGLGTVLGHRIDSRLKEQLNWIFGLCSMGMGVVSIVLMGSMPAVVLALVVGTGLGIMLRLGDRIADAGQGIYRLLTNVSPRLGETGADETFSANLITVVVLFCASGTGIYGSLEAGMTGDATILIAKSVLDCFTAMLFASQLGLIVSFIAIPQFIIFTILYLLAGVIVPLTTVDMIGDFKACGGFLMLASGFRIIGVKAFPTADMIPAMLLVMPFSWAWTTFILPMIG